MKKSTSIAMLQVACPALVCVGLAPALAGTSDSVGGTADMAEQLRILHQELARERAHLTQLRDPSAPRREADPAQADAARRSAQDIVALEHEIARVSRAPPASATVQSPSSGARPPHPAPAAIGPAAWWDVYAQPLAAPRPSPVSADSPAVVQPGQPQ